MSGTTTTTMEIPNPPSGLPPPLPPRRLQNVANKVLSEVSQMKKSDLSVERHKNAIVKELSNLNVSLTINNKPYLFSFNADALPDAIKILPNAPGSAMDGGGISRRQRRSSPAFRRRSTRRRTHR